GLYCSASVGSDSIYFQLFEDGTHGAWATVPGTALYELAFDGSYLWAADYDGEVIYRIDIGLAGETGTLGIEVTNGSEFAAECSVFSATVTVTSGNSQQFSTETDSLGRALLDLIPVDDNTTLTVSKAGFSDCVIDGISISAQGMHLYECNLTPEGEMVIPCDTSFDKQWGLFDPDGRADINAPAGWYLERGESSPVIVAIVSTGIDLNHPDLRDNVWINPDEVDGNGSDDDGNDFVDDVYGWSFTRDGKGSNGIFDEDGLGTAVAGIVAAKANDISSFTDDASEVWNVAGVSWGAQIMSLKFDGTRQAMWKAVKYAVEQGAGVILIPEGFNGRSAQLEDAVLYAASHNVVVVSGTGDDGGDATYPASFEQVLAVGATDRNGAVAAYSNVGNSQTGSKVDVVAPGGSGAFGDASGILTTLPTYPCRLIDEGCRQGYDFVHGTAYAAAFGAGACALLRSQRPDVPYSEIIGAVKQSAKPVHGLIDLHAALAGSVNNEAPVIGRAGFGTSFISEAAGGDLYILAEVSTPDGNNDIGSVELYFEGASTGLYMNDDGVNGDASGGDGIFTFYSYIFPGMFAAGNYTIGIVATDSSGLDSDMWPYLTVKSGRSAGIAMRGARRTSSYHLLDSGSPVIKLGGFGASSVTVQGGELKLTAEVFDPDGLSDVTEVELFLKDQSPLGVFLWDDGTQGDEAAGDGIFTFYSGVGPLAQGELLLEVVAYDASGGRSDTWPYLVVH
ncbi:S8 family serine peptidase, partial [bacterium]|nr:S8 family serine peptidase [bacterium]